MLRAAPTLLWILVQAAPGAASFAQTPAVPPPGPTEILIQGGSENDRLFARRALPIPSGGSLPETELETALTMVRATDRFRTVRGYLEPGPTGPRLRIELEAWPRVKKLVFRGDEVLPFRKVLFPELRRDITAGDFRIRRWVDQAQTRLREAGYPQGIVKLWRESEGSVLVAEVQAGPPAQIRECRVEGSLGPYAEEQILHWAEIQPGQTLWCQDLVRDTQKRLRQRFVKDKRLEGQSELHWDEATGLLILRVNAGPRVSLDFEGSWHPWWKNRKELVNPLARAGRYSPELLNEGDQRILHYLRTQGYLEAVVTHRREERSSEEVRITYRIEPGERVRIHRLRFEGNTALSNRELRKAAGLPRGLLGRAPIASPEIIGSIEERVKAAYWNLGYPALSLRKQFQKEADGRSVLVFHIQEKTRRTIESLVLEVPQGDAWQAWGLAECLTLILCDRQASIAESPSLRRYKGDRPGTKGLSATLQETLDPARPEVRRFTLRPSQPLPFVRNDIGLVFSALRQRASALGARVLPRPQYEEGEQGSTIRFEVPAQPLAKVRGLAIQGSDRTQARAVFREMQLDAGAPLAPERLAKAQSSLNGLGAFQRFDLVEMRAEGLEEGLGRNWNEGDLLLRADERPPLVVTSSFGYDKSQGYHFGLGIQKLNVGGMGRTLDLGIRAGDGTINSKTLADLFPTGTYNRSVDMFSLGYTDPWFAPNFFPDRTRFRTEAAYLEEHQDVYLLHRRRLISEFEWRWSPRVLVQTGYRFERSDVSAAVDDMLDSDLEKVSRSPARSVISAPFLQISRDTRDSALDPKEGSFSSARFEAAAQAFGTGSNSSYLKLDLRYQRHWSLGFGASAGVVTFGARVGAARPTASTSQNLPLSERFFAGGPGTHRGVEPDTLGPYDKIVLRDDTYPYDPLPVIDPATGQPVIDPATGKVVPRWRDIPLGGQAMALVNLEYRFPLFGQSIWGEIFVDSGQIYQYLNPDKAPPETPSDPNEPKPPAKDPADMAHFPPFRTAIGLGVIFKIGLPIKIEYAADIKRILGQPRSPRERDTQLKGLLVSAGFQF